MSGTSAYGMKAMTEEIARLRDAAEGTRNDTLNRVAFSIAQLVHAGHVDDRSARAAMTMTALQLGLPEREVERTLDSAYEGARKNPRIDTPRRDSVEQTENRTDVARLGREEASTWAPVKDWWEGPTSEPPRYLTRDVGGSLLYPAKVNSIIGQSGSGKTWLALLALQQAGGGMMIDLESDGPSVAERCAQIGLHPPDLAYVRPREPLGVNGGAAALLEALEGLPGPSVVVLDGFNTFLEMHELDGNVTEAVTRAFRLYLEPIAEMGHCLTLVDHTPHPSVGGGPPRAIGSQAKKSVITGSSLHVRCYETFGRGKRGVAYITVLKDRGGHVDRYVEDGDTKKNVAKLVVDATGPSYVVELGGTDWVSKERKTQEIRAFIEGVPGWRDLSTEKLKRMVKEAGFEMRATGLQDLIRGMREETQDGDSE